MDKILFVTIEGVLADCEPQNGVHYETMPAKKEARELWNALKRRFQKIRVISCLDECSKDATDVAQTIQAKKQWFFKHIDADFNPNNIIISYMSKKDHSSPKGHNILIDANSADVTAWNQHMIQNARIFWKGGTAILFKNATQTLCELEAKGFLPEPVIAQNRWSKATSIHFRSQNERV